MHDSTQHQARKWPFYLTAAVLMCVGAGLVLFFTPLAAAVFLASHQTTITFRNGTADPCSVAVTIIETEHGMRGREHRLQLPAHGATVIEVERGVKTLRYVVDGEVGDTTFDQWNGEEVRLTVQDDKTLAQD